MLKQIAWTWLILSLAGLALYVAFYAAFYPLYTEGVDTPDLSMFKDKAFVISMSKNKVFAILAVISFALTISIFLALDDDQASDGAQLENMTFASLGYMLLVKRKPLLAALVLTLVAMGLAVYFLIKSMGVTLEAEGSTLTVKFPWQTIHYIPIHSQVGWQDTGVELKAGQKVQYSIAGAASPGFLQDIDIHSERMREYKLGRIIQADFDKNAPQLKWPFKGPDGYRKEGDVNEWYKEMAKQDEKDCDPKPQNRVAELETSIQRRVAERVAELETSIQRLEARVQHLTGRLQQGSRTSSRPPSSDPPQAPAQQPQGEKFARKEDELVKESCIARKTKHYDDDTGLTVQGVPHNRIVGITLSRGERPNNPSPERPGFPGKPGYKYPEDRDKLIKFDLDPGQRKMEATPKQAGVLWVVINDADVFRWDNAGLYFMTLVIP